MRPAGELHAAERTFNILSPTELRDCYDLLLSGRYVVRSLSKGGIWSAYGGNRVQWRSVRPSTVASASRRGGSLCQPLVRSGVGVIAEAGADNFRNVRLSRPGQSIGADKLGRFVHSCQAVS